GVNKYGRTKNADDGIATDVWDAPAQPIWLAPTAARIHNIVSASDSDGKTGAPASVGARTLRIWGLTSWDTEETYEDITLDGTTSVPTVNSYVIIHRMQCMTYGASGPNVGIITATAVSDATVTARIGAGIGQTQMAIYGVPSNKRVYFADVYMSLLRAVATAAANYTMLVATDPENQPNVFTTKGTLGMATTGTSTGAYGRKPMRVYDGPGILKLQVEANAADCDVSGGFDLILEQLD
ncbi:MAG: hypothetical protein ACYS7Y_35005, partial [Planctomycetota bacterium]